MTIINADSAQVYAHLPILSAQPSPAEMASTPHRLFGYLDGRQPCSAAKWATDAKAAIAESWATNRLPVLVGGTGLYIRTLLDGIAPIPEIAADVRAATRALSTERAYAELQAEDRVMAAQLNARDDSRIKRALEVLRSTGHSMTYWRTAKEGGIGNNIDLHPLILLPPRDWLHSRCDARFETMMASGAVDEVKALLALHLPQDAPVLRAIGVREIAAMLAGDIDMRKAIALGQAATRQYAKRQYTWFRNQLPAQWRRSTATDNVEFFDKIEILFQF